MTLIFLCVAGFILAFHQSLIQWSLQSYLEGAAKKAGFELTYDKVLAASDQLIFKSPSLFHKEVQLNAEAIQIGYSFHPWERVIALEVEVISPEVALIPESKTLERMISKMAPKSSWFKVQTHLKSKEGTLKINQGPAFRFSLDHHSKENFLYTLALGDGEFLEVSPHAVTAKNFPIEVFNCLLPEAYEWIFVSGKANGWLDFQGWNDFKGDMSLRNLVCRYKKSGVEANFTDLRLLAPSLHHALASISFKGGLTFGDNSFQELQGELSLGETGQLEINSTQGNLLIPFELVMEPNGHSIKEGKFHVSGVALEKFVSPFLFPDGEFTMSGTGEVIGNFDGERLLIAYGGKDIQLTNESLTIDIPLISSEEASHTFNFVTGASSGRLPIINATYFDHNTGLYFNDIRTMAFLEKGKVDFSDLEAFSNNIYFFGRGGIDYSSPEKGSYTVQLHADIVGGSFSAFQQFFEHFDRPFFFTKIPLEGLIEAGKKGVNLIFDITRDNYKLTTLIDGVFLDGKILCPNADLSLQELAWNFTYDQEANQLFFQNVAGTILFGELDDVDELSLHAGNIIFSDLTHNIGSFNLLIQDKGTNIAQLKGTMHPKHRDAGEAVEFHFDLTNTYLGSIFPKRLELAIADWNRIENLELESSFKVKQLFQTAGLFHSFDFLNIPKKHLEGLSDVEGDAVLNLTFNGQKGLFEFALQARDVTYQDYAFREVNFSGYNRGEKWTIEQLQFDDVSIAAELTKIEDLIRFDFLGARFGEMALVGLEGDWNLKDSIFRARVNLFEAELNSLGRVKGSGELLLNHSDRLIVQTSLQAHLKEDPLLELKFKQIQYDFQDEALTVEALDFALDHTLLPSFAGLLHHYFPKVIDHKFAEQIGAMKKGGILKVGLDLQLSSLDKSFQLNLQDGDYYLLGENRKLKNFTIELQQDELKISSLYTLNQQPIWISARLNPRSLDRGSVLIADAFSEEWEQPALIVHWRTDPVKGFTIQSSDGYLAGLSIHLNEDKAHPTDPYAIRLSGEIEINGNKARAIFPTAFAEGITALKMGKGYKLQGDFEWNKGTGGLRFFGMLKGEDIELKGYQFQHLSAHMVLEPTSCQLLNCTLSDLAGNLHMANVRMDQVQNGIWVMDVPLVSIRELRPSLLQNVGEVRQSRKPLVIREMTLHHLNGQLSDINTFTADGQLYFVNPQKKHTQNVLFSIPAEILTRIGLNLSVLTPVTGNIQFDLKDGQFILKKFKDVYSDGKISKFYLSNSGVPSTINVADGKINVQMRFKQSTLLLKLVEMFTITVKGVLNRPEYSLQRQKYLKQEEVFSSKGAA